MCPHAIALAPATHDATCSLCSTAYDDLGVRVHNGVGTLRVWSTNATAIELVVFDAADVDWAIATLPLSPVGQSVWEVTSELLLHLSLIHI